MQSLEHVREKVGDLCPGCRRPKEDCVIYLTRHEVDSFATLPRKLDADDHYSRFYRRFRVAISRIDREHLNGSAADRHVTTRCLTEALFGSGRRAQQELEALGVPWHREPPNSVAGVVNVFSGEHLDYRVDSSERTVFVELKSSYTPNDLGATYLESIVLLHSTATTPDTIFYLVTLHCGLTQRDYNHYRSQFNSLALYARRLHHIEIRHVNLLPFYNNADSIVEFLETIRM